MAPDGVMQLAGRLAVHRAPMHACLQAVLVMEWVPAAVLARASGTLQEALTKAAAGTHGVGLGLVTNHQTTVVLKFRPQPK